MVFLGRPIVVIAHKLGKFGHRHASLNRPVCSSVTQRIWGSMDTAPFGRCLEGLFDALDGLSGTFDHIRARPLGIGGL